MCDPCILDIPVIHKPTYLNMDLDFEDLQFNDFIANDGFNMPALENVFPNNLNEDWLKNIKIDHSNGNLWVWASPSHKFPFNFSLWFD